MVSFVQALEREEKRLKEDAGQKRKYIFRIESCLFCSYLVYCYVIFASFFLFLIGPVILILLIVNRYNSLSGDSYEVTDEDMEAYHLKRIRSDGTVYILISFLAIRFYCGDSCSQSLLSYCKGWPIFVACSERWALTLSNIASYR